MSQSIAMNGISRAALLTLGWLCLILGFIGIFVPLLPTTPFVLVTAYCFSRASQPLHQWLISTKLFGPLIINWEQHGVITFPTKCLSTTMMVGLVSYPLIFKTFPLSLKLCSALTCLCVLAFIWTRPSRPKAS